MNNNKGFTLIEILAVLIVLAMIMTIAVPAALKVRDRIGDKMLDTKVQVYCDSVLLWADGNRGLLKSGNNNFTLRDLALKNVIKPDNDDSSNPKFYDRDKDHKEISNYTIVVVNNTSNKSVYVDGLYDGSTLVYRCKG